MSQPRTVVPIPPRPPAPIRSSQAFAAATTSAFALAFALSLASGVLVSASLRADPSAGAAPAPLAPPAPPGGFVVVGTAVAPPYSDAAGAINHTELLETFSESPTNHGWTTLGDASLFRWNPGAGRLDVTWDSRRTNSFYALPLPVSLTKSDRFTLSFDLRLSDVTVGINPAKASTFQISLGLVNQAEAFRTDFFRGSGVHPVYGPRSVLEFDYFPDSGFGATVSPTFVSAGNQYASSFNFPIELKPGTTTSVRMTYEPSTRTLKTVVALGDGTLPTIQDVVLGNEFSDFALDAVAVASYSDAGQDPPEFAGSVLAEGSVDNIRLRYDRTPTVDLAIARSASGSRLTFRGLSGVGYRIHRTTDFVRWEALGLAVETAPGRFEFNDPGIPSTETRGYYRVEIRPYP